MLNVYGHPGSDKLARAVPLSNTLSRDKRLRWRPVARLRIAIAGLLNAPSLANYVVSSGMHRETVH